MFGNYFKIVLRKLLEQKMYSFITISGLVVGLGVFLVIFAVFIGQRHKLIRMKKPPRIARWILSVINRKSNREIVLGDFEEFYNEIYFEKGWLLAYLWFYIQAFKSIPKFLFTNLYWGVVMFGNYFKIALRKLLEQKMYSFITISGLAVGLGIFLVMFAFFIRKMTADSFHKDIDRIYNVVQVLNSGSGEKHTAYIPFPLVSSLKDDIPEIEDFTRFYDPGKSIISYKEKKFYESQVLFTDTNFFSFFTFNIIEGNVETMFSKPRSVVISEKIAEKYFGDKYAIGEVMTLENEMDLVVTGVFKELTEQQSISSLYGQIIVPIEAAKSLYGSLDNWDNNNLTGFVKLQKGANLKQVENKLESLRAKYYDNSITSPQQLYLFPTKGLINTAPHIQRFANYSPTTGAIILLFIGFLFLLIGIFNYVNLSTARYTERLKELGIRKVIGAGKLQLTKQFLMESVITAFIAYPIAIIVYNLVTSFFSSLSPLIPSFPFWDNEKIIFFSIIISLITGFAAGIYPAVFLSSFRPVQILKGIFVQGKGQNKLRKILVILQFSISIVFVVLTLVFQKQSEFIINSDLGYNRSGVIAIPLTNEIKKSYPIIKERLRNLSGVLNTTVSMSIPGNWQTKKNVLPEGFDTDNSLTAYYYGIDYDFFNTMEMQISQGRPFSKEYQEDDNIIINQLFAHRLKWDYPIGKTIKIGEKKCKIVGVSNDFLFDNTFWPIAPSVFYIEKDNPGYILIKIGDKNKESVITDYVNNIWNELSPGTPFTYYFLDEYFRNVNSYTWILLKVMGMLGVLALLYSCLGLFALATYSVRKRRKEISIRQVMGATLPVILTMLSKDFLKFIILSNIFALPVAYWAANSFLDFVSPIHTNVDFGILIMTTGITLLVSLITITIQTYKAATANPVDSLKYE
ncbi:MAG: ABC transporter permease [Ignavibacteria bacterium]|jgi:ABC-type antimicrobial peptide transport system permease subunit